MGMVSDVFPFVKQKIQLLSSNPKARGKKEKRKKEERERERERERKKE